ncbi:hypothetical protein TWF730_003764 [Orbilia blumenaviensis]|uniref:N-acetyltransferase domain-containing protein n=1 Tax=Orbilia blumenaviensis TaxID=1796055 RepID=A0AAV9U3U4_9PEZI
MFQNIFSLIYGSTIPSANKLDGPTIRPASISDLDRIAEVAVKGFPDDPEFDYRFPHRLEYPQDHFKWVREEYKEYLEQTEKFSVVVVTTKDATTTREDTVISLAVWDMDNSIASRGGDLGLNERRDVNKAHYTEYLATLERGRLEYFSKYGNEQYHLWLLVTHPDFRKRGAGTMLCRWGMEKATEQSYMTTVLGSPMGTLLYEYLGFKLVGFVTAHVEGEEEKVDVSCLEYKKD